VADLGDLLFHFSTFVKVSEIEQDGNALDSLFINKFLDHGDQIALAGAERAFEGHSVDVQQDSALVLHLLNSV